MEADNDNELPRTRAEAIATGSTKYFTGEPCKHGHLSPRYVSAGCVECALKRASDRYQADPEANREYCRVRYRTNLAVQEQVREWRLANPEKVEAAREKWRQENPEKHKEAQKKWAANNPETVQSNVRARRARKRNAEGSHTKEDIEAILVRQAFKCAECGTSIRKRSSRQVDHIVPLKLGGSNWPTNLQLLCNTCNKVKAAKHPIDFAVERGRLV